MHFKGIKNSSLFLSSESGILLIRNDGTIQLKGDSKILGEYHLKHRLLARVKPDGSMGVFMIPEQGPNKGKMFAVLPNGPSGKEGIGWERVMSGGSTYLRPVFRTMTDKRTTPTSSKSTKPQQTSSDPIVIDLCDDSDVVVSQNNDVSKNDSSKVIQSPAPTPVMLFTKDSAAKLNSRSVILTPVSQVGSNQNMGSTSKTVTSSSSTSGITRGENPAAVSVMLKNGNPNVQNPSKDSQGLGTVLHNVKQSENLKQTIVQPTNPSVTLTTALPNTKNIQNMKSINVLPSRSSSSASVPDIASIGRQAPTIQSSSVSSSTQQLTRVQAIPSSVKDQLPSANTEKNIGVMIVNGGFNNMAQIPGAQSLLQGQYRGIPNSVGSQTPSATLNHERLPPNSQFLQLPNVGVQCIPSSSSVLTSALAQTQKRNEICHTQPVMATKATTVSNCVSQSSTKTNLETRETPIQINSVFSLAPVDPIRPWLTNGKNMPLSEVDFWADAINLKIADKILNDKRLRKGCSVILQRTTSHRPRKMRGCRFKDSQCNVACRKLFVKGLMKDLTRKKHLKLKRRKIYNSLSLQIRKKVKDTTIIAKPQEQPKPQVSSHLVPTRFNIPQVTQSVPAAQPTIRQINPTPSLGQPVDKPPIQCQNNRFLLLRMNGQNVLVPSSTIGGQCINFSPVVSTTGGMPRNVVPSFATALQVNAMPHTRSLLGARMNLSTTNSLTLTRPNAPTIPSCVASLPQLNSVSNVVSGVSVNNAVRSYLSTTSNLSSSNILNSNARPLFHPQNASMRLPVPSVGTAPGPSGMMNQVAPYPVVVRPANLVTQSAPYPVVVRAVNPSTTTRTLVQSQLTTFSTVRPVVSTGVNTAVQIVPPVSSVTSVHSSRAAIPTTTTTQSNTSSVASVVDEPVSSVAKSKVNKGTKYYFIPGGVKIKTEPRTFGYGDEGKKKHKKHKRPRSPSGEGSDDRTVKRQEVDTEENASTKNLLDDILKVSSETDIENLSKSEMSAERIKQLREKLTENQRKLEEYLRQVDQ